MNPDEPQTECKSNVNLVRTLSLFIFSFAVILYTQPPFKRIYEEMLPGSRCHLRPDCSAPFH